MSTPAVCGSEDVGILALEVYFPTRYVNQAELESRDGCPGKYTRGLGQTGLAFCDDREDITTVMLTALRQLLTKYEIDPSTIGRLEVGTETLVDKSKSTKTSLMALLGGCGDVEGVTSVNACYGGTAALFNSVAWVESSAWDGRHAVVVCGDIAVYDAGPARATSGCGAVAMLIGPDAPLALDPVRSTHATDTYDFYKPRGKSEYPLVDGRLSQRTYLRSVDACFYSYQRKLSPPQLPTPAPLAAAAHPPPPELCLPDGSGGLLGAMDYFCFHSPYHKLAHKGLTRLVYLDFLQNPARPQYQDLASQWGASQGERKAEDACHPPLASHNVTPEAGSGEDEEERDRALDLAFRPKAEPLYVTRLLPTALLNKHVGNCYSASIFLSLASLVGETGAGLASKRVLMFSYGSGSMASLYTITARVPTSSPFSLQAMQNALNLKQRLASRTQCSPAEFEKALTLREQLLIKSAAAAEGQGEDKGYEPLGSLDHLRPGTYYLQGIDAMYRRSYGLKA